MGCVVLAWWMVCGGVWWCVVVCGCSWVDVWVMDAWCHLSPYLMAYLMASLMASLVAVPVPVPVAVAVP